MWRKISYDEPVKGEKILEAAEEVVEGIDDYESRREVLGKHYSARGENVIRERVAEEEFVAEEDLCTPPQSKLYFSVDPEKEYDKIVINCLRVDPSAGEEFTKRLLEELEVEGEE